MLVDLSLGMVERLIDAVEGGVRVIAQCGGVDALETLVFQVFFKSLDCAQCSPNFRFAEFQIRSDLESKSNPQPKEGFCCVVLRQLSAKLFPRSHLTPLMYSLVREDCSTSISSGRMMPHEGLCHFNSSTCVVWLLPTCWHLRGCVPNSLPMFGCWHLKDST